MSFEKFDEGSIAPPQPERKWLWAVAAGGLLLLVGGGALVSYQALRRADAVAAREREQQALAALEVAEADARLPGSDVAAQVRALERLLAAQREAAEVRPSELNARAAAIERTEAELQRLRSEADRVRSEELERRALELTQAGNLAAAAPVWREALDLQRAVNRAVGETVRGNDRLLRLEQELQRAQAEPQVAQIAAAMAAANAAVAAGDWDQALARFREAREAQERLNREFPRSRFSDLTVLTRIDAEIAALTADGLEAQVQERWGEARRLAASGQPEEAIRSYEQAAEAQRKLNTRFARSRFVSMERLEEIEADLQTLRAAASFERIAELEGAARAHLRRRQTFQAQTVVQEALALDEEVRTQFPRTRGANESLRLSLAFLKLRSADLAALQDRVYETIAPLPGNPALALLRGEVTQADFARVMATNPSRTGSQARPVESVTHGEAEEFCRRLSWILGWRVRLPEPAELQAARGDTETFAALDSGLEEWLAGRGAGPDAAPVWTAGRVTEAARTARAADRGFRFVVEIDLAAQP